MLCYDYKRMQQLPPFWLIILLFNLFTIENHHKLLELCFLNSAINVEIIPICLG